MSVARPNADLWAAQAEQWIAWARSDARDAYWHYRDAFLAIVPPPRGLTLDVGCGEGRVARDLARRGHAIVAVDSSHALVRAGRDTDRNTLFVVADAAALPFRDEAFGTTVACNALMDFDDIGAAIAEIARALAAPGNVVVSVVHPVVIAGAFLGPEDDAMFAIRGSYFERQAIKRTVERNGVQLTLGGYRRPIEDYVTLLADEGLVVTGLFEPQPAVESDAAVASDSARRGHRVPMFLHLTAIKQPRRTNNFEDLMVEWCGWFREVMPDATPESFLRKVREEIEEFIEQPSIEEMSDTLVTLVGWLDLSGYDLAQLLDASRAKLATNRGRTWVRLADGRYKHVDNP
jgi:SAM-dependent methyltransferase